LIIVSISRVHHNHKQLTFTNFLYFLLENFCHNVNNFGDNHNKKLFLHVFSKCRPKYRRPTKKFFQIRFQRSKIHRDTKFQRDRRACPSSRHLPKNCFVNNFLINNERWERSFIVWRSRLTSRSVKVHLELIA